VLGRRNIAEPPIVNVVFQSWTGGRSSQERLPSPQRGRGSTTIWKGSRRADSQPVRDKLLLGEFHLSTGCRTSVIIV
jgi:hypothetical protein